MTETLIGREEDKLVVVNPTLPNDEDSLVVVHLVNKILSKLELGLGIIYAIKEAGLTWPVASSKSVMPKLQKSAAGPYDVLTGPSKRISGAA